MPESASGFAAVPNDPDFLLATEILVAIVDDGGDARRVTRETVAIVVVGNVNRMSKCIS